jgi:hypothetical protein
MLNSIDLCTHNKFQLFHAALSALGTADPTSLKRALSDTLFPVFSQFFFVLLVALFFL